jgi:sortase A
VWLRRFQYGTAIIGAVLIAVWFAAWVHGKVTSRRDLARFETARSQMIEVARLEAAGESGGAGPVDVSLWAPERVAGYQESLLEDLGAPLAVLRIPRLEIEVPVLDNTGEVALNRGAGWIEGTARPGAAGNCGLAGHRDGFFRGLKDIVLGDVIEVETLAGTHRYTVDELTIVDPSDVSVLEPRESETVTLVTCYPFYFVGSAPERFIVHASLMARGRGLSPRANSERSE